MSLVLVPRLLRRWLDGPCHMCIYTILHGDIDVSITDVPGQGPPKGTFQLELQETCETHYQEPQMCFCPSYIQMIWLSLLFESPDLYRQEPP